MSHMSELAAEEEQAMMDVEEDRYHDICDEPSEQDWIDNKGDLICHQRMEEP